MPVNLTPGFRLCRSFFALGFLSLSLATGCPRAAPDHVERGMRQFDCLLLSCHLGFWWPWECVSGTHSRARTKIVLPRQNSRSLHSKKSCGLRFLERQLTQPSEKEYGQFFFPSALEKMPIVLSVTCSSHLPKHFVCLLHRTTIECISKLRCFWEWKKDLDSHIRKMDVPKDSWANWGWVDTASQDPHSSG